MFPRGAESTLSKSSRVMSSTVMSLVQGKKGSPAIKPLYNLDHICPPMVPALEIADSIDQEPFIDEAVADPRMSVLPLPRPRPRQCYVPIKVYISSSSWIFMLCISSLPCLCAMDSA